MLTTNICFTINLMNYVAIQLIISIYFLSNENFIEMSANKLRQMRDIFGTACEVVCINFTSTK